MAEIRLEEVEKIYAGSKRVLHGLDLTIRDGEFLVLVGPSGCGKSTILRIVAGLEDVTRGRIWIGNQDVTAMPPRDRDIAMVFQSYALYPHLTVFENLAFGLRIRRRPKDEVETKVRAAASLLGIEPLLDKQPRALSGGERQRVALGRALVRDPQVFLFDEPLSNLDAKLRSGMRAEISGLHRRLGVTTIYVTHDQVEAMTMGQRIVVLDSGVVQQIGPPLEVYNRPANRFVAGFIGNPSMNFFPDSRTVNGEIELGHGLATLPSERKLPEGKFTLGIRPEHLVIDPESSLKVRTTLIEPTGGEAYVYGDVVDAASEDDPTGNNHPPSQIILRTSSETRIEIGDEIRFRFSLAHAHFFDSATNERITS